MGFPLVTPSLTVTSLFELMAHRLSGVVSVFTRQAAVKKYVTLSASAAGCVDPNRQALGAQAAAGALKADASEAGGA